jgi:hypothetical protein
VDYRKHLDRAASRNSAANLTLGDIAECVADGIRASERRMVEHMSRAIKLVALKDDAGHEETRINNLHRRLCAVESELRRLARLTR